MHSVSSFDNMFASLEAWVAQQSDDVRLNFEAAVLVFEGIPQPQTVEEVRVVVGACQILQAYAIEAGLGFLIAFFSSEYDKYARLLLSFWQPEEGVC